MFQGPHILQNPKTIKSLDLIHLKPKLQRPWVLLVRICGDFTPRPMKAENIRFRKIDQTKLQIFWNDYDYPTLERCVKTYEIYYAPTFNATTDDRTQWSLITQNKHVPFLSFCHQITSQHEQFEGKQRHFTH